MWGTSLLDSETRKLVQRWIIAFCEAPVLIDAELMRRVLDDAEAAKGRKRPRAALTDCIRPEGE